MSRTHRDFFDDDISIGEALAELRHSLAELRAGRESPPPWATRAEAIVDLEGEICRLERCEREGVEP